MLILPDNSLELRKILKFITSFTIIGLFLSYLFFQARLLVTGPQIVLAEELPTLHNTRMIELTGTTHNITHLWLNDRQIFTDEEGNFREPLVLENSYTITTLRAKDRYGRETEVVRSYVYRPASFIIN